MKLILLYLVLIWCVTFIEINIISQHQNVPIEFQFTTDKLTDIIALHQDRIQDSRFNFLSLGTPLKEDVVAYTAVCSSE